MARPHRPLALAGLVAVLAIYLAHAWSFRDYINDDAFITFRYSRFLALGRGPYFNAGEHVEGYSNPLLMLLIAPVIAWGGESAALPAAKIVGVVCGSLSLMLACGLAAFLLRQDNARAPVWPAAWLAAGIIAVSPSYVVNSVNGLETALFGLTVTAGVALGVVGAYTNRWRGSGLAFALCALARPEGALMFAVYWWSDLIIAFVGGTLRASRSRLLLDAAVVGATVGLQIAFRHAAYDGEWLPNTYYAKAGGLLAAGAGIHVREAVVLAGGGVMALAVAIVGCLLNDRARRGVMLIVPVVVVGTLLPFVAGPDWMPGQRLVMPYLPLAGVFVAVALIQAVRRLVSRPLWMASGTALLLLTGLWIGHGHHRRTLLEYVSTRARGYRSGHIALAEWMRGGAAKPGDTIALMDTGLVGYMNIEQRILDITGLTDRVIGKSPGGFTDKRYDPAYVLDQKPRYIVIVLTQPGNPDEPPSRPDFRPWTSIERRLLDHPDFSRWYRYRGAPNPDASWLDGLTRHIGARRIFPHAYPGAFYLLAVFERQDTPGSW